MTTTAAMLLKLMVVQEEEEGVLQPQAASRSRSRTGGCGSTLSAAARTQTPGSQPKRAPNSKKERWGRGGAAFDIAWVLGDSFVSYSCSCSCSMSAFTLIRISVPRSTIYINKHKELLESAPSSIKQKQKKAKSSRVYTPLPSTKKGGAR